MIRSIVRSMLLVLIATTCLLAGMAYAAENPNTIRIIYSNDTKGYLEPCSCGGKYLGGLSRRTTAISKLVQENPHTVIVESGNLSDKPNVLGMVTKLLTGMKYDAVGVGAFDLAGGGELFRQAETNGLKIVDALRPESKSVAPYVIKNVDGVRVGVVSYGADYARGDCKSDARQTFHTTLKAAREASDVLILLDQGGIANKDWLDNDAGKYGVPDIVIGGLSNMIFVNEQIIGRTHIMPTWLQGTKIGVIDVEVCPDHSLKMTAQALSIDKDTPEDESVRQQIRDYLDRPKKLASLSPSILNLGNLKKGSRIEEHVTLTPKVAEYFAISKAYSSGKTVSVPEWKPTTDGGGYRIKIVADAGNTTGRFLETVSIELDLPDHPTLNMQVFGNVIDE